MPTFKQKLLEVQREIGTIKKDSENPFFKSKYFDINGLLAVVKPVLNKHSLILLQELSEINAKLALETTIMDSEGDGVIRNKCPLPEVADAQKAGSAITYFRRYALQSLLALEAEDDDANMASEKTEKKSSLIKPKEGKLDLPDNDPLL